MQRFWGFNINIRQQFTSSDPLAVGFATLFLIMFSCYCSAQTPLSNTRSFHLKNASDTLAKDSLTIIPNSIQIIDNQTQTALDSSFYTLKNNVILKRKSFPIPDTHFTIQYRVLPIDLGKKYSRLDSSKLDPLAPKGFETSYTDPSVSNAIFEKGLDYNGNYTQGFSIGNSQNLVVNQNFNLNLAGKLGDLDVLASMTDNNLPIQAEGNTLELRQFDRIFIQLKKKNSALIAGDYELSKPNSYFTNYYKKLQGITLSNTQEFLVKKTLTTHQTASLSTKGSAAIARGKFSRLVLEASEGNQGPYRLLPNSSTGYIIVLAATEKVFFDGKLLTRGDENDYVIDYNSGTIQFTPKRLVTKDSRIIVEFEYADQSYLRSTMALSNEFKINRLKLNFSLYSEQDSKNSSGTQALDSIDKRLLIAAGNIAPTPLSIRPTDDGFRSDRIQYKLVDTVVRGVRYSNVLVFSTHPDSARYTASFSPVGDSKGNYVQDVTAANGRVYRWVAPDSAGLLRGAFEPVRTLVPPNQQQLATLGMDYQVFKNTRWVSEVAMSRTDANRFSSIGDSSRVGWAVFSNLQNQFSFGEKEAFSLQTDVKFEATQRQFKPLNPYRAAEFTRDWNLPVANNSSSFAGNSIGNLVAQQSVLAAEKMVVGHLNFSKKNWFTTSYEFSGFQRDTIYRGTKQVARFDLDRKGWHFGTNFNQLNTEGVVERSKFSRPNLSFSKSYKNNLSIALNAERERNERKDAKTDTLTRTSFAFDSWRASVNKNTEGASFGTFFSQRYDYQPLNNQFLSLSNVNELGVNGNFSKKENQTLIWNLTYRDLRVSDTSQTTLRPQESYLGRVEYNFNFLKTALTGSSLYEIGSGQEQKIEYQYVRVNKGEGQYIWRNRNNDTIPQLDEFEIAPFPDQADYVRVSLFTNQFVRTNNVAFAQSVRFEPRRLWVSDSTPLVSFIKRFSTQSNVQISRRVKNVPQSENTEGVTQWNPFELSIPDRLLVGLTLSMRHSVYFNRNSTVWDAELGQLSSRNRFVVVTGFEERGRSEFYTRQRWNIGRRFTFLNYISKGEQLNRSEAFRTRDYNIAQWKIEPQMIGQIGKDFRLGFQYKYRNGYNTLKTNGETIVTNDFSTELTYNRAINGQFRGKFGFIKIAYVGEKNTPVEFAMLEGLQNGRNFVWNISFDQSLSKNILLSLSYDGRKTGESRVVHVGRAQVRANF
ncbi:MAG: hypothetical protein JNL70_27015 [Saprospiraceae bacterium]|nr:hypothetical protein [Saprospiraceae bacterium]